MSAIDDFLNFYRSSKQDDWLFDCKNSDFENCIRMAATARNLLEKKHPHQYRIKNEILELFAEKLLLNKNKILSVKDFDKLYVEVEKLKIKGIGALTIYDTAHRIGRYLNVSPQKVYLHRGARIGAEKLLKRKIKSRTIGKIEFPMFLDFTCEEIEDILCLSKGNFEKNNCFKIKVSQGTC